MDKFIRDGNSLINVSTIHKPINIPKRDPVLELTNRVNELEKKLAALILVIEEKGILNEGGKE